MGHIDILCQYHLRLHSTVVNTAPQFQCTGCGSIYALCVHVMMSRVLPLRASYVRRMQVFLGTANPRGQAMVVTLALGGPEGTEEGSGSGGSR